MAQEDTLPNIVFVRFPSRYRDRCDGYFIAKRLEFAIGAVTEFSGLDKTRGQKLDIVLAESLGLNTGSAATLLANGRDAVRIYPTIQPEETST